MSNNQEGRIAPDFSLTDKTGARYTLAQFDTPWVVVFFYPKDDTPGCTVEAKSFSDSLEEFAKRGATIIGISGGTDATKAKFCKKSNLDVLLLSDTDFSVAKSYQVFGPKKFMGRSYEGISRETFLLGARNEKGERAIVKHFSKVTPASHVEEVLGLVGKRG
jgi:peroxiredoxin Q/BCP